MLLSLLTINLFIRYNNLLTPLESPPSPTFQKEVIYTQTGIASFYGIEEQGKLTANSERFDRWKMTAAHNSLPFNTKVKVTNLQNNKSVIVRINDRGGFVRLGRCIDMSEGAFIKIADRNKGLIKVKLEVIN